MAKKISELPEIEEFTPNARLIINGENDDSGYTTKQVSIENLYDNFINAPYGKEKIVILGEGNY